MAQEYSSRPVSGTKDVKFHPLQVAKLEEHFPERVLSHTASEAELREYFGTRKVLQFIKAHVNK